MHITDVPDLDKLERQIVESFNGCSTDAEELREIIVFGSYGRGGATKGESDLDIFIDAEGENPEPVSFCMVNSRDKFRIDRNFEEWFDDYDVVIPGKIGRWGKLLDYLDEKKPREAYSLTERSVIGRGDVEDREKIEDLRNQMYMLREDGLGGGLRDKSELDAGTRRKVERIERKIEELRQS